MEVIDRLEQYYDIDTRIGLCNMILEYVYVNKIEDMPEPGLMDIIKTLYYLTIGRVIQPRNAQIYIDLFNALMENEEELDRLIGNTNML